MKRFIVAVTLVVVLASAGVAAREKPKWKLLSSGWKIFSYSQYSEVRWCAVMLRLRNDTGKKVDWVKIEGSIFERGVKVRTINGMATKLQPGDVVEVQMEPAVAMDKTEKVRQRYSYRIDEWKWQESKEQ
jgi:opacity protein-like surface antigen